MKLYRQFTDKRKTETDILVKDTLPERKLQNFKSSMKTLNIKLKDKVVLLNEELNLITKFLLRL